MMKTGKLEGALVGRPRTPRKRESRTIATLYLGIDRSAAVPLTDQVATELRRAIDDGVLAPGTRLPASRILAAELAVARVTVVVALRQLVDEGYLESRERSGIFVAGELPEDRRLVGGAPRAA